ncbi:MAG TPA: transcription antitermination factor NusB [Myxococcota bacterium]|nr:transcription antitermination factor NusB [Myxococcota bacterium]
MAREAALQVLFAAELSSSEVDAGAVRDAFESVREEFDLPKRARERALELCLGVVHHLKDIDLAIARASEHWKVERLAAVERNVLRVAAFELLFEPATPAEVVIDEAVEVARRFASEKSPAFVNGVLDVVARNARAEREGGG